MNTTKDSHKTNAVAPLMLRPSEAAKALAISPRKLWSMTAGGEIPCKRFGRTVRYVVADLQSWLAGDATAA